MHPTDPVGSRLVAVYISLFCTILHPDDITYYDLDYFYIREKGNIFHLDLLKFHFSELL